MKELIEVKNEKGELLVSARDLHKALILDDNREERFSQWFKRYLKYGFEENIDYFTGVKKFTVVNNGAKRELDDYALKIDMAKEICMLQKSDKGRQYRKYFLECERKLKEIVDPKAQLLLEIYNGGQGGVLAAKQLTEIEVREATKPLLAKIEEDKPLVEFAETISKTSDSIDIGTFSKLVKDQNIKIGRNKLFEWLRDNGYLMKSNIPYQKYIDNNYFEIVEYTYKTPYGEKLTTKTLITGLGQVKIIEKLRKELNN